MKNQLPYIVLTFVLAATAAFFSACTGGQTIKGYTVVTGGDVHRGAALIGQYRCGACHIIPGIANARGNVGPPLLYFADRTFVGGEVPNNPQNLIQWIQSPKSIEPGTAMPDLGVTEQQARDIAAYLYTLR
ncbi:MAG: c-type cytochrome [Candidatus Sulfotelmatobacter sp.]